MSTHATTSIGRKILGRSLLIALPPLILLAIMVLIGVQRLSSTASDRVAVSRETLSEETVVVASEDRAISIAREINLVLRERVSDVAGWARSSVVVDAADAAADDVADRALTDLSVEELEARFDATRTLGGAGEAESFLSAELEANDDFRQIAFTDVNGYNVVATSRPDDFVQSDEEWWQEAVADGLSLSDVEYDAASDVFSVDVAVRVDDPRTDATIGVIQTSLSISFVQAITTARSLDTVDYTVALADGRLIADTASDHSQIRMMSYSFAGGAASPGLGSALDADLGPGGFGSTITDDFVYGYTSTLSDASLDIGVDEFGGFDWIVVSSQPTDVAFAPLRGLEELNDDISDSGRDLALIAALMLVNGIALAVALARRMTRQIVEPVQRLTSAASEAASDGLPAAVHAINEKGADLADVDVPTVEISTNDELQTLATAFNSVQTTALRLAAEQAKSRRNTTEMFVNLGRRNQSLIKRQLRFIDSLEDNEQDPDTLESLFKLDHLATRMRRNAESLLVLAGDRSPRRWAAPIDVRSAVEAALAEVESYERVDLSGLVDGQIQGNIVADVAHILAELIENGLNFSPPSSEVVVSGRVAGEKYIVTISDDGLGMKQDEIDRINQQLSTVIEITDVPSQQLGLFVVARLASRHGISVRMSDSPSGGLTVRVEVPLAEIEAKPEPILPATATDDDADAADDVAEADSEVQELLAKAEAAMAKAAEVRAGRSEEEIAEEEERLERLRAEAAGVDQEVGTDTDDGSGAEETDDHEMVDQDTEADTDDDHTDRSAAEVEVGEFSFPRRQPKQAEESTADTAAEPEKSSEDEPRRRKTDPAAEEAPHDDLAAFGFTRREAKRPAADEPSPARRQSDRKKPKPTPDTVDDVEVVAEKSRNQWGSFQRGKKEAEAVTAESETAADAAATKET